MSGKISEEIRLNGLKCLKLSGIKNDNNCEVIEKIIYKKNKFDEKNYKKTIYECFGLLKKYKLKELFELIQKEKFEWENPIFDDVKEKIREHDEYLVKPFEVLDGVNSCKKCGSTKTWSIQKQTRSSDEPMTTCVVCVVCSHTSAYNG